MLRKVAEGIDEMSVRAILTMGDLRLLRVAQPVKQFDTPQLHALVTDLKDTMRAARGAGLAAPQLALTCRSSSLAPMHPIRAIRSGQ